MHVASRRIYGRDKSFPCEEMSYEFIHMHGFGYECIYWCATDLASQCPCVVKFRVIKRVCVCVYALQKEDDEAPAPAFISSNTHKTLTASTTVHLLLVVAAKHEDDESGNGNHHKKDEKQKREKRRHSHGNVCSTITSWIDCKHIYDATSNNETLSDCYKTKIFNRF